MLEAVNHTDRVQIKLCGLRREEDIRIVNEVQPEYAGFILAKGRKRTVAPEQMRELSALLRPGIRRTAVFLDQDPEWIAALARQDLMDVIQLHGSESSSEIRYLQEKTGKPVIKAFRIDTEKDIEAVRDCPADLVLLDHGNGGSGEMFDWSLAGKVTRPFFLAGGLTPENVRAAILQTAPAGVDVSSGVETGGWKDAGKARRFAEAVRRGL